VLFALPALRTRGLQLAVVTLGLGAAADSILFQRGYHTPPPPGSARRRSGARRSGGDRRRARHPVRRPARHGRGAAAFATLSLLSFGVLAWRSRTCAAAESGGG